MIEKTQIYSIESDIIYSRSGKLEDSKGVIYLFGRDSNKEKIVKIIRNFSPYFYIEKKSTIPQQALPYILKIDENCNNLSLFNEDVKKVYAKSPKCVPEIRKILDIYKIKHFEADILYRINFSLSHYHDLIEKNNMEFGVENAKIFVLDIETTTQFDIIDPKNVPENIISITIHDNYTNKYHTWIWRNDFEEHNEFDGDKIIHFSRTEINMLNNFLDYWKEEGPDFVVAHNGDNFDWPYIINKCKQLGISVDRLSPIGKVSCWDTKSDFSGEVFFTPSMFGVVLIDSYHWYKEIALGEQRGYSLDAIAQQEGLGIKGKINSEQEWKRDYKKLIEYNVNDVALTKAIFEKRKMLQFVNGIRKVALCNVSDLYYFSRAIDCLALQKAKELNLVLPTKPSISNYKSKAEREETFTGAWVMAKRGVYENVGALDFSSLYPNLIRTMNLSYETYNYDGKGIEVDLPKGVNTEETIKIWVNQERQGLLPQIIEKLINLRQEYEEGLKNSTTEKEANAYDNLIQSVKNLICVVFGAQANESFRLYKREGASLITYFGRRMIKEVSSYLEKKGLEVVYNDTDSCYVKMKEGTIEEGKELEKELNQHILDFVKDTWNISQEKNFLSLKFEKMFKSLLVDKKKRYANICCWKKGKKMDKLSITGFNAKRSDCSDMVEYLQTEILEMVLRGKKEMEIEKLIFTEIDKIKNCEDYSYIGVPVRLGKEKYLTNIPKARAAEYSKKYLGLTFLVGQKPLLIYLKHKDSDCILFEDNEQLKDKEIILDVEKMVDRNIFLTLGDILIIWKGESYWENLKSKILNYLRGQKTL